MAETVRTKEEISREYGINGSKILGWETGVIVPDKDEICFLAEYFRITRNRYSVQEFERIMSEADAGARLADKICQYDGLKLVFEMLVTMTEEEQKKVIDHLKKQLT